VLRCVPGEPHVQLSVRCTDRLGRDIGVAVQVGIESIHQVACRGGPQPWRHRLGAGQNVGQTGGALVRRQGDVGCAVAGESQPDCHRAQRRPTAQGDATTTDDPHAFRHRSIRLLLGTSFHHRASLPRRLGDRGRAMWSRGTRLERRADNLGSPHVRLMALWPHRPPVHRATDPPHWRARRQAEGPQYPSPCQPRLGAES
jgi:hypothetical protein